MAVTSIYTYKPPPVTPVPAVPDNIYNFGGRPNAGYENTLTSQYNAIPGIYDPQRTAAKAATQAALQGYGGYSFGVDDPNTPVDESLNVNFDPTATPGERYRDAARNVRMRNAARGLLHSSYANRDLGAEAARLSAQARDVVNRYAQQLTDIGTRQWQDTNEVTTQLTKAYGEDAGWLKDQVATGPGSRTDALYTWKEWADYQRRNGQPDSYITPARFWSYISKHGGTVPAGAQTTAPATGPGSRPDKLYTWQEWADYQRRNRQPASYITPAHFWAYIKSHGGTVPSGA